MPKQLIKHKSLTTSALLSIAVFSQPAHAGITKNIEDALNFYHYGNDGAVTIDLNYRFENFNQDRGSQKTANGNTARLRLGYITPKFYGFQGFVEYEGNLALEEDYNSTRNGKTGFSTIADPSLNELNQAWITYAGIPDNLIKVGRQRIKIDDDRFIGNVGWRQLEQTYDALLWTHNNQTLFGLVAKAGYIGTVQTFTGITQHIEAPFLNVNYKVGDYGNIIGYGYWLNYTDTNERATIEQSNQTYGLRANATKPIPINDNFGVTYNAEYSHQSNYGNGPTPYNVDRYYFVGGLSAYKVLVQGAVEQLDGVGANKHFDTPLGTNHAFQGWADNFLITPNNGIRDVFASISIPLLNDEVLLTGVYHDFFDDTGKLDYGSEWDFQATKKFGKHYSLLAKYATYNAGTSNPYAPNANLNTDTQKVWLGWNVNF
ncbi:MAG: alginate export family protein [Methylococcaceae bacterium]|jgi:hypothetical protein